jgi:ankyrin repeat protein
MDETTIKEYSGINPDGSLKKFATPTASTIAAKAAVSGGVDDMQNMSKSDLLEVDDVGNTPLIWAADSGNVVALKFILAVLSKECDESVQSIHINQRGYLGNTALGRASRSGHVECVSALISHDKINPNICNEKMQYPLHFGSFKKHIDVVDLLLKSGKCDTCVKDRKDRTPAEDTSVEQIKNMILDYRKDENLSAS